MQIFLAFLPMIIKITSFLVDKGFEQGKLTQENKQIFDSFKKSYEKNSREMARLRKEYKDQMESLKNEKP